jgi:hypothetical protein
MGYYINKDSKGNDLPASGKFDTLVKSGDAKPAFPTPFSEIPSGKALLCIVDNGMFDAVAYAYSEAELKYFLKDDGRDKLWLEMDKELAERLSDYNLTASERSALISSRITGTGATVPSEPEPTKPSEEYTRERKPKKKTKKNSFVADYRKGYAVINGSVKEAKPKTEVK